VFLERGGESAHEEDGGGEEEEGDGDVSPQQLRVRFCNTPKYPIQLKFIVLLFQLPQEYS